MKITSSNWLLVIFLFGINNVITPKTTQEIYQENASLLNEAEAYAQKKGVRIVFEPSSKPKDSTSKILSDSGKQRISFFTDRPTWKTMIQQLEARGITAHFKYYDQTNNQPSKSITGTDVPTITPTIPLRHTMAPVGLYAHEQPGANTASQSESSTSSIFRALELTSSPTWYAAVRYGTVHGFMPCAKDRNDHGGEDSLIGEKVEKINKMDVNRRNKLLDLRLQQQWKKLENDLNKEGFEVIFESCPTEAEQEIANKNMQEDAAKKNKKEPKESNSAIYQEKNLRLHDYIGTVPQQIHELRDYLQSPTIRNLYTLHTLTPPKGMLFHGPPGTGKTYLARCLSGELAVPCHLINSPELLNTGGNQTEQNVIKVFAQARKLAEENKNKTAIICLDEIDTIGSRRINSEHSGGYQTAMNNIVNTLLTCIDGFKKESDAHLIIIGCTNRLDKLDPALIRAGRLETHINLPAPDQEARYKLLLYYMQKYQSPVDEKNTATARHLATLFHGKNTADINHYIQAALRTAIQQRATSHQRESEQITDSLRPITDTEVLNIMREKLIGQHKNLGARPDQMHNPYK